MRTNLPSLFRIRPLGATHQDRPKSGRSSKLISHTSLTSSLKGPQGVNLKTWGSWPPWPLTLSIRHCEYEVIYILFVHDFSSFLLFSLPIATDQSDGESLTHNGGEKNQLNIQGSYCSFSNFSSNFSL